MPAGVIAWGTSRSVDAMYRDGFQDPLSGLIMGETAEVLARQYRITREESDQFALESQQKAEAAQKAGHFRREIVPVTLPAEGSRKAAGPMVFDTDEHPRHGTTREALAKLPLAFPQGDGKAGIITAGSSSGITDGGAALVLASDQWAADRELTPLARIAGWASAGVDPRIMGIGPVPAIEKLRHRSGLEVSLFDLVEINEAFAAQVLAVLKDVDIRAREGQRQRRGDRSRSSHRLHRCADCGDAVVRDGAPSGGLRSGHPLRERRNGDGDGGGEAVRVEHNN